MDASALHLRLLSTRRRHRSRYLINKKKKNAGSLPPSRSVPKRLPGRRFHGVLPDCGWMFVVVTQLCCVSETHSSFT